jgi:hypothetical protein
MHSMLKAGVVDEVRMLVCPASRGKGTRVFEDRQDLKLVEGTAFVNGVVLLRYEIQKQAGGSRLTPADRERGRGTARPLPGDGWSSLATRRAPSRCRRSCRPPGASASPW